MTQPPDQDTIRRLMQENLHLKQQVFELDQRLKKLAQAAEGASTDTAIMRVLKGKDIRLEEAEKQLEEKQQVIVRTSAELDRRSAELHLWMDSMRLYTEIFENEPSAIIGLNAGGNVILFNRAATAAFGDKFRATLRHPIESVDFSGFDPATPRLAREAISRRQLVQNLVRVRDRRISTSVFPMITGKEMNGVLIKIAVVTEK